ncbi:MAG: sigma 54-interacting transcriptional regulator, partial [Novosphingobium sp.]
MILLADDEPAFQRLTGQWLRSLGHEVEAVGDGDAARAAFARKHADVVLLDLSMPPHHDPEAGLALIPAFAPAPVVVMTGYASVQNAVTAMKRGAFDYLPKPFSEDELAHAVARAIENKRLKEENQALRRQLFDRFNFSNIIGENPKILKVFGQVRKVAPTDSTVLIHGSSGTGKEIFAKAIHAHSRRAARQFIAFDCSTIAASLMESELFGHVRGAFTGAVQDKAGIFAVAMVLQSNAMNCLAA